MNTHALTYLPGFYPSVESRYLLSKNDDEE